MSNNDYQQKLSRSKADLFSREKEILSVVGEQYEKHEVGALQHMASSMGLEKKDYVIIKHEDCSELKMLDGSGLSISAAGKAVDQRTLHANGQGNGQFKRNPGGNIDTSRPSSVDMAFVKDGEVVRSIGQITVSVDSRANMERIMEGGVTNSRYQVRHMNEERLSKLIEKAQEAPQPGHETDLSI